VRAGRLSGRVRRRTRAYSSTLSLRLADSPSSTFNSSNTFPFLTFQLPFTRSGVVSGGDLVTGPPGSPGARPKSSCLAKKKEKTVGERGSRFRIEIRAMGTTARRFPKHHDGPQRAGEIPMRRFLSNLFRDFRTSSTARGSGWAPHRATLQVEGLEDRLVMTSAAILRLPPPPTGPNDYFAVSATPVSEVVGSPLEVSVTEMGPNGPVTSGAVGSANLYFGFGTTTSYLRTINLINGVGATFVNLSSAGPWTLGTWTIKASYVVPTPPGAELVTISGQTSVVLSAPQGVSPSWSGYAIDPAQGTTAVGATWVQSAATGAVGAEESMWVGIDGNSNGTVEQIGTTAFVGSDGQTHFDAWWEFAGDQSGSTRGPGYLPQTIPLTINPGDTISAEVSYVSSTSSTSTFLFQMTVTPAPGGVDGGSFSQEETTRYVKPARSSAEWIVENPAYKTQALPDFGTATFTGAWATIGSTTGAINDFANVQVWNMSNGLVTATVDNNPPNYQTAPGFNEPANGLGSSSFSITWGHDFVQVYSAQALSFNSSAMTAVTANAANPVNGIVSPMQASAGQTSSYLDKHLAPERNTSLAADGSSLSTWLLSADQPGKTNSANVALWVDLADRDEVWFPF
jgi:Peptidase A4 family